MTSRPSFLLAALGSSALALAAFPAHSAQDRRAAPSAGSAPAAESPTVADCPSSLRDASGRRNCIQASTTPVLGSLYPISEDLFVQGSTGWVGIHTTTPFRPLDVVGPIATSSQAGQIRVVTRPSSSGRFGVIETIASPPVGSPEVTNLITSVSIDETAGALATVRGQELLTALTTSAADSRSGYVTVRSQNVEVAGIDGFTGTVFGAAKAFCQPHPEDATKEIRYVSLEGPENGVYFRGTLALAGGQAVIETPESFRLVARAEGLTVSLTPLGPNRGLYVAEKGLERILVRENPGGTGTASFDFLVMGERAALPPHEAIRENVHFAPAPGTTVPEESLPGSYRALMIANGTLNLDGSVNDASAARLGWRLESDRWTGGRSAAAEVAER